MKQQRSKNLPGSSTLCHGRSTTGASTTEHWICHAVTFLLRVVLPIAAVCTGFALAANVLDCFVIAGNAAMREMRSLSSRWNLTSAVGGVLSAPTHSLSVALASTTDAPTAETHHLFQYGLKGGAGGNEMVPPAEMVPLKSRMARRLALIASWIGGVDPSIRSVLHCHPSFEGLSEEEIEDALLRFEFLLKGKVDFDKPIHFHCLIIQLREMGMEPSFDIISSDEGQAVVALSVGYHHIGNTALSSSTFRSDGAPEYLLPLVFKSHQYRRDDGIILYRTTAIAKVAAGYSCLWQIVDDLYRMHRSSQVATITDGEVSRPPVVVSDISSSDADTTGSPVSSAASDAASSDGGSDACATSPSLSSDASASDATSGGGGGGNSSGGGNGSASAAPMEIDSDDEEPPTCVFAGCDRPRGSCSCICSPHQAEVERNEWPIPPRPRGGVVTEAAPLPAPKPLPTPNPTDKPKPNPVDLHGSDDSQSSDGNFPFLADDLHGDSSSVAPGDEVRSPTSFCTAVIYFCTILF